ncbi:MAG: hypothetical protein CL565_05075 [Alphaproteobacteria bacterium]|nr:hypothetical protein [Alphaproteobacteria bacterium]
MGKIVAARKAVVKRLSNMSKLSNFITPLQHALIGKNMTSQYYICFDGAKYNFILHLFLHS